MMADRRLRVFYTVARLLSFTRAAETLHMTQPAVTFQVRQLEDYLNTRLFDRNHHRVALTESGRIVYEYAERIFELYAEMDHALKELAREADGALTVGATREAAEQLLPALLRDFKRRRPELNLKLKILGADELLSEVANGAADMGVVAGQVTAGDLQVDLCQADELVVIAPPQHPLTCRGRAVIHDLADYFFIAREPGCWVRETLARYLAASGIDGEVLKPALELSSLEAIKGAVEVGMGIAILARSAVAQELEAGSLSCIRLEPPIARLFSFVRRRRGPRAADEFLEFARGYSAEAPAVGA
jgi:LysR family transcriptional regulator, transcriptional activator of the cysJI operon